MRDRLEQGHWRLCVVVDEDRVVHGLLTESAMDSSAAGSRVADVMELGPSTIRPHSSLEFEKARLHLRALRLEYATIAWNVGEAFLTIALGSIAGSVALIGFGTVSIVEVFASSVVVWHLRGADTARPAAIGVALRMIAAAFLLISLALFVVAVNDVVSGRRAGESPIGIAYLAVTAVVMFALAVAKRRIATALGSEPLGSEATVTFLDGVLSVGTLLGLALNAYLGWWWADPVAGMLVAVAAANESRATLVEARSISAGEL